VTLHFHGNAQEALPDPDEKEFAFDAGTGPLAQR
jgi:hypothetical protein